MNTDKITTITGALAGLAVIIGQVAHTLGTANLDPALGTIAGVLMAITGYFTNKGGGKK